MYFQNEENKGGRIMAQVIDFFEWKYNHKIVPWENCVERLREYLDMELAEAMRKDFEDNFTG